MRPPTTGNGSGSPTQLQAQQQQQQIVPPPPPPQQQQQQNGGGYYQTQPQQAQALPQQQQQQQHVRSGSREEYRDHGRSEDRNGNGNRESSAGRADDARKRNPLSIGSIISDDVSR